MTSSSMSASASCPSLSTESSRFPLSMSQSEEKACKSEFYCFREFEGNSFTTKAYTSITIRLYVYSSRPNDRKSNFTFRNLNGVKYRVALFARICARCASVQCALRQPHTQVLGT